jgi:threonine dehydratase
MVKMKPTEKGVVRAAKKMAKILPRTPLLPFEWQGVTHACKCESDQPIGAFKIRGAWHRLTELSVAEQRAGVVAFSSGNHAQGVAWAAQRLGILATIVMPSDAPVLKVRGTRNLGAEIVFYDRDTEDRVAIASTLAAETGAVLVPSFDDAYIIEGQGSAGIEVVAQNGRPFDTIISCCGGGGLAAGLALSMPDAEMIIVEPDGWDDMGISLCKGEIVPVGPNPPATQCDALQTPKVSRLTFDILHKRGAQGVSVSEEETEHAVAYAYATWGKVIEPGGAVALAAVLSGKVTPKGPSLITLSGGNIDPELHHEIIERWRGRL